MIPRKLHYCWFGKAEFPPIVKECLESWKEILTDYEIYFWNENNVPIKDYLFMHDAYNSQKYAFVSDYARFWILKQYGGIFLDCDVKVLKRLDNLLHESFFLGFCKHVKKDVFFVNPGLIIGAEEEHPFLSTILDYYDNLSFFDVSGKPNLKNSSPRIMTKLLMEKGLIIEDKCQKIDGISVYSSDYFDPVNPRTLKLNSKIVFTENTYTVHLSTATWVPKKEKIKRMLSIILRNILGDSFVNSIRRR